MKKHLAFCLIIFQSLIAFSQTPTWADDIAKIIYANCTPCHHPGGIAPSSFMTYQNVVPYAGSISYAVTNRIMPPWPADPNYKRYAHDHVLSQADINAIQQWVSNGAPSGDLRFAPPAPTYNNATQLGTVDLSLKMQNFTVPSNGDIYRNFVLNTGLLQTNYATAIEVIPGNPDIVHHVLVFMDTTNTAINPNSPGGTGSIASKLIYGYVPGAQPYFTPPGTGFRFTPNTRIILQMHYAPGSMGLVDSTRINFKLTTAPQREIAVLPILNHFTSLTNGPLSIPANTTKTFYEQQSLNGNWTLLYAWPHMHMIGRNIKTFATTSTPNDTIRFVNIPNWNFHWQMNYVFANTVKIPNGSTFKAVAYYDNTSNNPFNPNSPPQNVSAGEGTGDEMMMVFFAYMPYQNGDENLIVDKRILPKGATTFCEGQSVLLKTIEGTGYTYQWYRNGTIIQNATSASYNATESGNYTVSITLGPNNAVSDPVTVTVNAKPNANITPSGSTALCPGENVTLNAPTGSGYSYRWFKDGAVISNATASSYTTDVAGDYTVEVFNGCYAVSNPVTVSSASSPNITASGSTSICEGDEVTLTASAGSSYLWSDNSTTQSITVNATGTYSVTVSGSACSGTTSVNVVVNDNPQQPEITVSNNTLTSSAAAQYEWLLDGNPLGMNTQQINVNQDGCYQVKITDGNGCSAVSDTTCMYITDITPLVKNGIVLYPNPFTGILYVDMQQPTGGENIIIYDITGKICFSSELTMQKNQIDLSNLKQGMYFALIRDSLRHILASKKIVRNGE